MRITDGGKPLTTSAFPNNIFIFDIEGDEKIQIKHKGSKLQILNKEIEEFETRLEKIKLSPKTITTQKEMYKINQNKFNPTRFFQGTSLESKEF